MHLRLIRDAALFLAITWGLVTAAFILGPPDRVLSGGGTAPEFIAHDGRK